jgi:hypothetical protein
LFSLAKALMRDFQRRWCNPKAARALRGKLIEDMA